MMIHFYLSNEYPKCLPTLGTTDLNTLKAIVMIDNAELVVTILMRS